jgi:hypothetical protein
MAATVFSIYIFDGGDLDARGVSAEADHGVLQHDPLQQRPQQQGLPQAVSLFCPMLVLCNGLVQFCSSGMFILNSEICPSRIQSQKDTGSHIRIRKTELTKNKSIFNQKEFLPNSWKYDPGS